MHGKNQFFGSMGIEKLAIDLPSFREAIFGSLRFISTGIPMSLKASKTTLTLLLCFGFVTALGCKSLEFSKPKLPTLPKLPSLAFWKKGEDSELPPPPARHFDPSRFGDGAETQVAESGSATRPKAADFDQYGIRIKDTAREVSDVASSGIAKAKASVEKNETKPVRKPYKLDDLGGDEVLAKAENKFNLDAANLKNRFDDVKDAASNQLSSTQQDFRSAMSSAANLQASGENAVKSISNSFGGGDNSFVAKPISKAVDTVKSVGSIGGGSFASNSNAFSNVKRASANGKEALYDAQGRLQSAASKISSQAQDIVNSSDANSLKTKFEQRLLAAQKQAQTKSEAFKSGALNATNDQLSNLAKVSDRTKELISQPFPKIGADGSLLPQRSAQTSSPIKQSALQPNNSPLLQLSKPNDLAANSFGGTDRDEVLKMRSEVEEAKRQIALLKAQMAAAKQSVAPRQPAQRVAQNTIEGIVLPLDRGSDAFNPKAGLPVANQGQSFLPAASQPPVPSSPNYNSNPVGGSNSFYPATPYGGFGSTQSPKGLVGQAGQIGQVGFDSASEFQNRVSRANGEAPVNSSGIPQAGRIGSSASEVLIPSAILSGSSSFTPGSTTPLR